MKVEGTTNMKVRSLACLFALTACSAGVDDFGGESEGSESVATNESAIVGGTPVISNRNYAAIYHKFPAASCKTGDDVEWSIKNDWWPRPCSGIVVKKDTNTNWVLTARHCITVDGEINTDRNAPANLKLTSRLAPSWLHTVEKPNEHKVDVQADPPTFTVPAAEILKTGAPAHSEDYPEDIALVRVVGDLQPSMPPLPYPIYFNNSSPWVNRPLTAYGYGRSVAGHCWNNDNSGAGTLRTTTGFTIEATGPKHIEHTASTLVGGDSGGPIVSSNANGTFESLVGVNSTGTTAAGGASLLPWLQSYFGHLYLIAHQRFGLSVVGAVAGNGNAVGANFTANINNANTWVTYDTNTKQIKINGRCVQDMGADLQVRVQQCTTATSQQWAIAHGGNIRSVAGRCWSMGDSASNYSVFAKGCGTTNDLKFYFTADDSML